MLCLSTALLIPTVIIISVKVYLKLTTVCCTSKKNLAGKTAIVTGANTGIGLETAVDLAKRNARVIIACRDPVKGLEAQRRVIRESANTDVVLKTLDLNSLKSVRQFAKEILEEEPHLEILVNNAGIASFPKMMNEDGLERTFCTNYFGPFLLTNLLLDLLKKSAPSRIVNLSSIVHKWGAIELDNLRSEKFSTGRAYFDSKLATVLFTRELAKRLAGTGVTANSLHPGSVRTELMRARKWFLAVIYIFLKTPKEGAQTSIHCAVCEKVEGVSGKYFSNCTMISPAKQACDDQVAERLWRASCKLVGLEK